MSEETADTLRLHHCPECGYDLRGLPREGKCPECGFAYEESDFSLEVVDARSFPVVVFFILLVGAILSFVLHPVSTISWLILGWAAIVGIWNVPQIRRIWQKQSDWVAFTKRGVWVKEPRAKALMLPWVAFVRVVFKPFEFAMKDGKKIWRMRLYRDLEPEEIGTFPYRFGKRHTDLVFELRAGDDEAIQIRGAIDAFLAESRSSAPDEADAIAE